MSIDDDKTILIDNDKTLLQSFENGVVSGEVFETSLEDTKEQPSLQKPPTSNQKEKFYIQNPIQNLLEKYNLLDQQEINALNSDEKLNIDYLTESYVVNIDKLYKVLSTEFAMRYYNKADNLLGFVDTKLLDMQTQKKLGILVALLHTREETLEYFVLLHDPYDYELQDYIKSRIKDKLNFALAKKDFIKKIILQYVREEESKREFSIDENKDLEIFTTNDIDDLQFSLKQDVPIIPLVNYIILNAHDNRVSDIHIEPTEDEMIVRYRIDGVLNTTLNLPVKVHREVISRIKIMSEMNVAEKRLPQDGRFAIKSKSLKTIDLRVSTFPTVYGEKIVLRLLEQDSLKLSLDDLDFTAQQLDTFKTKINSSYGLVLITGPTGSGKTTTLYSALSTVDRDKLNVVTLENPVEYRLSGVNQMQTNEAIGLTFASGLRTILRQDPDVIMLGEIRDLGTAQMAIRASLTGHMVFSTLHTNDAVGVIIRLVTMGIDPFLVASSVSLVVAQRLIRKICPHCATTYDSATVKQNLSRKGITERKIESLGFDLSLMPDFTYGKGCSYCRGSGYLNRRALFEFFEFNEAIVEEILKKNIDESKIRELAKEAGLVSLQESAWELVTDGVTTIEEVVRVIGD